VTKTAFGRSFVVHKHHAPTAARARALDWLRKRAAAYRTLLETGVLDDDDDDDDFDDE
jgi:hypothetical protein